MEPIEFQFDVLYDGAEVILCIDAFTDENAESMMRAWCLENNATELSQ